MDRYRQQNLATEFQRLSLLWQEVRQTWTDAQSGYFERQYWEPISSATRRFLDNLAELERASRPPRA